MVVPTKDRPMALSSLMGSLLCQSLRQFDLIIALNGARSWDGHLDRLAQALEMRQIRVRVHECLNMTLAQLHEFMIEKAESDYICRLDDDHLPNPNYLQRLKKNIDSDKQVGAVGGVVLHPGMQDLQFSEKDFIENLKLAKRRGILNTIFQLKKHPTDQILQVPDLYATFMMKKEAVQDAGGVATCYASSGYREETDLTLRMTLAGYKQIIDPKAIVWHIKSDQGGERKTKELWQISQIENERLFQERLQERCKDIIGELSPIWDRALLKYSIP